MKPIYSSSQDFVRFVAAEAQKAAEKPERQIQLAQYNVFLPLRKLSNAFVQRLQQEVGLLNAVGTLPAIQTVMAGIYDKHSLGLCSGRTKVKVLTSYRSPVYPYKREGASLRISTKGYTTKGDTELLPLELLTKVAASIEHHTGAAQQLRLLGHPGVLNAIGAILEVNPESFISLSRSGDGKHSPQIEFNLGGCNHIRIVDSSSIDSFREALKEMAKLPVPTVRPTAPAAKAAIL